MTLTREDVYGRVRRRASDPTRARKYAGAPPVEGGKDGGRLTLASFADSLVGTDESQACATFRITSLRRDRHGDVMSPRGCEPHLANYHANPRVFFSHKSDQLPVGSARTSDGSVALFVTDADATSTVKFHLKTQESDEVCALVMAKELQACSIGFLPVVAQPILPDDPELKNYLDLMLGRVEPGEDFTFDLGGLWFKEWDLYEWSIVPIPANPDAVAMRLSKGIGGKSLSPAVREALLPYAPAKKQQVFVSESPTLTQEINTAIKSMSEAVAEVVKEVAAAEVVAVSKDSVPESPTPTPEPEAPAPDLHGKMCELCDSLASLHKKVEDHHSCSEAHHAAHKADHEKLMEMHKTSHEHHKTTHQKLGVLLAKQDAAKAVKDASDAEEKALEAVAKELGRMVERQKSLQEALFAATGKRA